MFYFVRKIKGFKAKYTQNIRRNFVHNVELETFSKKLLIF